MPLKYERFGGSHAETASLANGLRALDLSVGGQRLSEAMILGIGGGLGAGYLLFEFKASSLRIVVIGWRALWNYPVEWYERVLARLGLTSTLIEGGKRIANEALNGAINSGRPAIAWVDQSRLPYHHLAADLDGCFGHVVGVAGMDGDRILLDDLGRAPFAVSADAFYQARERITSYRCRLLTLDGRAEKSVDLPAAIRAGIRDCVEHLGADSQSFALPTYVKWARLLTSHSNKKGWPVVFADRAGLLSALMSVYEYTERFSSGGGGLRPLYADFLEEAGTLLGRSDLTAAGLAYRRAAVCWTAFAQSALPDEIALLGRARMLLDRKYALLASGVDPHEPGEALIALTRANNPCLAISAGEFDDLLATMADTLIAAHRAETEALDNLRGCL